MEDIARLDTVSMIFIAGMTTTMILPYWMSFFSIVIYVGYRFGIIDLLWHQIPAELRDKYNSKTLIVLEWLCDILRQGENVQDETGILGKLEILEKLEILDKVEILNVSDKSETPTPVVKVIKRKK